MNTKENGESIYPREERGREIFADTLTLQVGHFQLSSGRHTDKYIEKRQMYLHTQEMSEVCEMIAGDFRDKNVDVVVGPERGGIVLSFLTASFLTKMTGRDILNVFAQKKQDGFEFHKDQGELIRDKRVLIVDDVITTGESIVRVIKAVEEVGGEVIGAMVVCNRGNVKPEDIGVDKIHALINLKLNTWSEDECPICKLHGQEDFQIT